MTMPPIQDDSSLIKTVRACRQKLKPLIFFSAVINVLALTTAIYMMQVFDRVIGSQHWDTLLFLTFIAIMALLAQSALDAFRARVFARVSSFIERELGPEAVERGIFTTLRGSPYRSEALRDLGQVRSLVGGTGIVALFDAPWVPIYLIVVFLMHPIIGWIATGAAVVLFAISYLNERLTRGPLVAAGRNSVLAFRRADATHRNAEVVDAMGLARGLIARWTGENQESITEQQRAADLSAVIVSFSKFMRQVLQVVVLAVGAWLAAKQEMSAGAMIASSILISRALAPIEQSIGTWKQVVVARDSYRRLREFFNQPLPRIHAMPLPAPKGDLNVESLTYASGPGAKPILKQVNFAVPAGTVVAVVGPSGAGKSTLARLLVGVARPSAGAVRLDGADIYEWNREDVGKHLGYIPQDVELFAGTVKENIARMADGTPESVVEAAQLAGVHNLILHMQDGYQTQIGDSGTRLSAGQRQRIALARALYGKPRFVVLDEPNSNLDTEGETALTRAIEGLKRNQTTVVLISHRPALINTADKILVLNDGTVRMFGNREEVLDVILPGRKERPAELSASAAAASVTHRSG